MTRKQAKWVLIIGFALLGILYTVSFFGAILTGNYFGILLLTVSALLMVRGWQDYKSYLKKQNKENSAHK